MKFLVWAAVVALVVIWIWIARSKKSTAGKRDARPGAGRTKAGDAQPMLQCAECGIHLPASEALAGAAGTVFCSEEHRLRHAGR